MAKRSEEIGFSLMNTDSPNHDRIPGDCHHNDTTAPLPVGSPSPFSHWNLHETSQYYSKQPAGGNSMIDSPQFKSYQNFQMDHNYSHKGEEHNFFPCRPDSCFPCPEGYIGWPYQYNRHSNLTIPADVGNAAFNLNNFEKPNSGGMCVTPSYGLASRPQMVNPSGTAMGSNIGQPPLDMNLGMALCNPNQGGAEPLLAIGKLDERFMTIGSGTNNIESKSSAVIPKFNVTGSSERAFLPPINTYHNQLGSRSSLNPGLDMNGAFSAFQNDSEIISDLAHAGDHEALFDSRPGLCLGPSYAFQRPAAGDCDQNHYLGQVNRDLSLGGVKDIGMEFTDVGHKNGLERCMDLNSLPVVGGQTIPFESGQSRANGQLVPSSSGMVTDKLPAPKNNDNFSSQSFSSPPLAVATRSTRGKDPSSNNGQSQAVGSIQQSNSPLRRHSTSDLGISTGKGNMTAQVSRPSIMSSLKRAASQPLSSTVQHQHRKTLPTQFIHPSIPTWTRLDPSVPNTPRAISPLVHPAQSLRPEATHSVVPPLFPTTWAKSALPAPNTTRAIPPLMHTAPFLPPNDKRISSFHHPSSHTSPRTNQSNHQRIAQALAHQRLKAPIIPSAPSIASNYIKFKGSDQTPEPIGHKCFLCKRDLSYAPEGPISQPPVPPAAAVLPCGHTFHEYCLERITPDDQSKDPPCIPCALRE
ncbi:hypothetical protein E2542_SST25415 [Spatholobus suberectus]|nr:hypothetical protein E2542_SST25415 [Spatholobus suberectus]